MSVVEARHETLAIKSDLPLHVHRWGPTSARPRARLLIVHGYAEHAERYREFAHALASHRIETTCPDLRGHGRSEGLRGHVDAFDDYARDVDAVLATLPDDLPRFLLGHSNGGLIALDYTNRYAPSLNGLILTNPFLELEMQVPALKAAVGRLVAKFYPKLAVPSGIPPEVVSRDEEIVAAYARDPLVFKTATVGYVIEQEKTAARVQALEGIELPLLYIRSDSDPLVSPRANAQFSERLASPDKTVWLRKGERHEVLNELDRAALHRDVANWILQRATA